jgi:hypothetical protein
MQRVYQISFALSSQKEYTCTRMSRIFPFRLFITKKPIFISLGAGILLNFAGWLWLFFGVSQRTEEAVLHYTSLYQIDQLGPFSYLYHVPLIGLSILVINFLIGWFLYSYDIFLAELIVVSGAWLQIGILSAVSILAFLNA